MSAFKNAWKVTCHERVTLLLRSTSDEELKLAISLAQEKGALNWLNVLPIVDHDF